MTPSRAAASREHSRFRSLKPALSAWVLLMMLLVGPVPSEGVPQMNAAKSPYPPSPLIGGIVFRWETHDRRAPGSDNWPMTWARDGNQYTNWGDGGGFGGTNEDGRVSMGVARVEGPADHYTGHNVWGGKNPDHSATFPGKSYGMLAIGDVLYMWVSTEEKGQRLYRSTDYGATWEGASWAFPRSTGLILLAFCQFGRGYEGARDEYVYSYSVRLPGAEASDRLGWERDEVLSIHKPGQVDLMRVPAARIMDRAYYQFFAGFDENGNPTWTRDVSAKAPVFEDPNGVGWCVSVSYNPGLRRYLLTTEHGEVDQGNLGFFDGPQPWGPWTTVTYLSQWGGSVFYGHFPNKWLSRDGKNFTFVFTGIREWDSWNTIRGSFALVRNGAAPSAPAPEVR